MCSQLSGARQANRGDPMGARSSCPVSRFSLAAGCLQSQAVTYAAAAGDMRVPVAGPATGQGASIPRPRAPRPNKPSWDGHESTSCGTVFWRQVGRSGRTAQHRRPPPAVPRPCNCNRSGLPLPAGEKERNARPAVSLDLDREAGRDSGSLFFPFCFCASRKHPIEWEWHFVVLKKRSGGETESDIKITPKNQ